MRSSNPIKPSYKKHYKRKKHKKKAAQPLEMSDEAKLAWINKFVDEIEELEKQYRMTMQLKLPLVEKLPLIEKLRKDILKKNKKMNKYITYYKRL